MKRNRASQRDMRFRGRQVKKEESHRRSKRERQRDRMRRDTEIRDMGREIKQKTLEETWEDPETWEEIWAITKTWR